ncbi:unnamed protein product [Rhizophagus irregularis]|nr:unnamed protein product [Rhizophagus irregularis]
MENVKLLVANFYFVDIDVKAIVIKGKNVPPCKDNCTVICEHTSCNKRCLEPCAVCAENCSWECEHQGRCELSCGVPCYRLPCNERCNKILECGHNCAGVCEVKNQVSDINSKSSIEEGWTSVKILPAY